MRISDWSSDVCSSDLRALEPRQVAFAPAGGGDAQRAAVEVDHPDLAIGIEQQVVGVEVDVVEAGAMEARDQEPGLVPRRAVAFDRGNGGQRAHVSTEERRVGKECVRQCRYGVSPDT